MKILFLDNDGVICLSNNWGGRSKKWSNYRSENPESSRELKDAPVTVRFDDFDKKAISVLNEVLQETGAEIVVSSDWKLHVNLEELGEYYESQGIIKKPIAFTDAKLLDNYDNFPWNPFLDLEQTRSLEIAEYLTTYKSILKWVAIDDLDMSLKRTEDGEYSWGLNNFVHTPKSNQGIKESGIKEKIIKFLND